MYVLVLVLCMHRHQLGNMQQTPRQILVAVFGELFENSWHSSERIFQIMGN